MNILVAEDEPRLRRFLTQALGADNHQIFEASSRQELLSVLESGSNVDLIILDRLLGASDTAQDIPAIRRSFPRTKILVLSAIDSPEQKAEALDSGAHDYMSKPFSLVELQARIRNLFRASESQESQHSWILEKGNVRVDQIKHRVTVSGDPLALSNKEYNVLITLMKHPGRIYNKYQLLDAAWPNQLEVESNVVEVTIKNLRKKLLSAQASVVIQSQRGLGYWVEE
ncbi:MAG: response regulator transcription factor [Bdellovibrionaceae bacterium]|nr:response regulator transcription factor [Pseudobdellovibrionaceae bacterium]